jgi:hypothetical protein
VSRKLRIDEPTKRSGMPAPGSGFSRRGVGRGGTVHCVAELRVAYHQRLKDIDAAVREMIMLVEQDIPKSHRTRHCLPRTLLPDTSTLGNDTG